MRAPWRQALRWGSGLLLLGLLGAALWLWRAPPALARVAAGYTAKIVCSSVFVAGRDAADALQNDVQAPGHPLLRLMQVTVDREARLVRAELLGFAGHGLAVARDGTGCATVPDGDVERARAAAVSFPPEPPLPAARWPEGDAPDAPLPAVAALLDQPELAGPGLRAVLVLHRGRIVAERYLCLQLLLNGFCKLATHRLHSDVETLSVHLHCSPTFDEWNKLTSLQDHSE